MNAARILVTGATGFLGRHLVPRLLAEEGRLTLTTRKADLCPSGWRGDERIRVVETGPLETAPNLEDALAGVGTVVHLAGLAHVRGNEGTEQAFMLANAVATRRLAEAAADAGVGAFIHLSSLATVTENASTSVVGDDTACEPRSSYGASKLVAEKSVLDLAGKGIFCVSLRPPLIVGADAKGNWAALQRLAATGLPLPFASVRNKRSMIGIGSVTQAIALLCSRRWPSAASGGYCIADRESLSLPEIVTALRKGMGMPPRLVPFPPSVLYGTARIVNRGRLASGLLGDLQVDDNRFRAVFGFSQRQSLADAIAKSGMLYRQRSFDGANGGVQ